MCMRLPPDSQKWDITPESLTPLSITGRMSVERLLALNHGKALLSVGAPYR